MISWVRQLSPGSKKLRNFVFDPDAHAAWPGYMLILASRDDAGAMAKLAALRERYPRARVHMFDQGGHHTYLFFPEAYTTALPDFLTQAVDIS